MIARLSWSIRAQLAAAAGCVLVGALAIEQHRGSLPFFLLAELFVPLSVRLSAGAATLAVLGVVGLHAVHADDASDIATGLALILYGRALLLVMLALRRAAKKSTAVPMPASPTIPALGNAGTHPNA